MGVIVKTKKAGFDPNNPHVKRMLELFSFALAYYRRNFVEDESRGRKYMLGSGFSMEILERFKVGFAGDGWDFFKKAGRKNGYEYREMERAGLLNYFPKTPRFYDVYRNRVMVPFLHHTSGQCIGFVGRLVSEMDLNSKQENLRWDVYPRNVWLFKFENRINIYNKEVFLFGLYQAASEIKRQKVAYVVTDFMDVIRLAQFGVTNVVSSSGIPFTTAQATLLKDYADVVVLVIDDCNPGLKAAGARVDVFLALGIKLEIVVLDRDWKSRFDSAELDRVLRLERKDYILFKASNILGGIGADFTIREKALRSVVRTIGYIPSHLLREMYINECAKTGGVTAEALKLELLNLDQRKKADIDKKMGKAAKPEGAAHSSQSPPEEFMNLTPSEELELELIRLLLRHNYLAIDGRIYVDLVMENIFSAKIHFTHYCFSALYSQIRTARELGVVPSIEYFQNSNPSLARAASSVINVPFSVHELRPFLNKETSPVWRVVVNRLRRMLLEAKLQEIKDKSSNENLPKEHDERNLRFIQAFEKAIREHRNIARH